MNTNYNATFKEGLAQLLINNHEYYDNNFKNINSEEIAKLFDIDSLVEEIIIEELEKKIISYIKGSDLGFLDINKLYWKILIEEYRGYNYLLGSTQLAIYAILISMLQKNRDLYFTKDIQRWEKVLNYLFAIKKIRVSYSYDWRRMGLAQALNYFSNKGYNFEHDHEGIVDCEINRNHLKEIDNLIKFKLQKCGAHFYSYVLTRLEINNQYGDRKIFKRDCEDEYYRRKEVQLEPLGIALKLAAKHVEFRIEHKDFAYYNKECEDILEVIKNYYSLFLLGDYSRYDTSFPFSIENFNKSIRQYVLFDQYYTLPQLPSKFFIPLAKIFDYLDIDDKSFKEDLRAIRFLFCKYNNHSSHVIDLDKFKFLNNFLKKIKNKSIRSSYLSIYNEEQKNFEETKLSANLFRNKISHKWIFCNHPCTNILLFEYLTEYAKKILKEEGNKFGEKWGKSFEEVMKHILEKNNITFLHNAKYNIDGQEGECDFIIETSKEIIILECKTRVLFGTSRTGSFLDILLDISEVFLHSQYQAHRVNEILIKKKNIKFENPEYKLEYQNRQVITISVSLLEYFQSLMDKHLSRNLFEFLYGARIEIPSAPLDSSAQERISNINKRLSQLNKVEISKSENIFFLSLQQVLTILECSKCNEEFAEYLLFNKLFSSSYKDWYERFYSTLKILNEGTRKRLANK